MLTKAEKKPDQFQALHKSFQRLALTGRSSVCGDEFSSLGETGMTPANSYSLLCAQLTVSQASDRSLGMALGMGCGAKTSQDSL